MRWVRLAGRPCLVGLLVLLGAECASGQTAQDKFYRAYYLEQAEADWGAAATLYAEVLADPAADAALKARAQTRLTGIQEELAASDFARLMPQETLAYVEFNRPGEQLRRLLGQLGLVAGEGPQPTESAPGLAISPRLIQAVLGMRGAAVAITGFDPEAERPTGVAVLHPGDMELIRGMVETAVYAAGKPAPPIEGLPSYELEGSITVTLSSRLVIVGTQRAEIEAVIDRLRGRDSQSLLTSPDLAEVLKDRGDALLFFCVNARPLMPLLNAALAAGAAASRELALARALLDPGSFRCLSGRVGVREDGVFLDARLELEKGHRNLVYSLLRLPPISSETLRCVPAGAAALVVLSLNEEGTRFPTSFAAEPGVPPVVSAMDFGREIFGNIVSLAAFVMPPDSTSAEGGSGLPDMGLVITSNDPERSQALWGQVLGLASVAAGGPETGTLLKMDGTAARRYRLDERMTLFQATCGQNLIIANSQRALARAVAAAGGSNESVLQDGGLRGPASRIGPHTVVAAFAQGGRCGQIARRQMAGAELAEAGPFIERLRDTELSLVVDQSDTLLRVGLEVSGLPRVGDLVSQLLSRELDGDGATTRVGTGELPDGSTGGQQAHPSARARGRTGERPGASAGRTDGAVSADGRPRR